MKTFCRRTYNSNYYNQNRDRILHRRTIRKHNLHNGHNGQSKNQTLNEPSQLPLFEYSNSKLNGSKPGQSFWVEFLTNAFLVFLVISISYFLLSEAFDFYRSNSANVESSILAAVIVELLLLAFSVIHPSKLVWKIASKTLILLLFAYSSWSFCSGVIGKGYGAIDQLAAIETQISRMEARIKERNVLIGENLKLRRITLVRRMTLEKDKLNSELSRLDADRMSRLATASEAQIINTWSMVALRLLLQISNIVIVHHLVSRCRRVTKLRRDRGARRRAARPLLRLVKDST
jgi:succinate dehydrogenase hydrophobic anchor subunit